MGYGAWLHGEAVGAGMCMAAKMSALLGWFNNEQVKKTISIMKRAKLPTTAPDSMDEKQFLDLMSVDKKVLDGVLRLVLLKSIGDAVVTSDYSKQQLAKAIKLAYTD